MTTLNDPSRPPELISAMPVRRTLVASITRVRRRLLIRAVLRWTGAAFGGLALAVALDRVLHLGSPMRWTLLIGFAWILSSLWKRWITTARRVDPQPSDLALNLHAPYHASHAGASIAAIVDLPNDPHADPIERALAIAIGGRSAHRVDPASARAAMKSRPVHEMFAIALGLLLLLVISVNRPMLVTIGARRMLTPWSSVQWPKQFGITLDPPPEAQPSDRALVVGAMIGPSTDHPNAQLRWRLLDADNSTIIRWTTLALNKQGLVQDEPPEHGQRYEQLIPIQTLSTKLIPTGAELEYQVTTRDDESAMQRLAIVHPPKLQRLLATVTLPEYAQGLDEASGRFVQGEREIGLSVRSIGPVLAGSSVQMRWVFDSPVALDGQRLTDSTSITTTQILDESTTLTTTPVDAHALSPRASMEVFVRVTPDSPPEAIITDPSTDLVVGPRALINLRARITDDLGLTAASITSDNDPTSTGTEQVLTSDAINETREHTLSATLDLQAINAQVDQQLEVRAQATDTRGLESRSAPRLIRVVEDRAIVERVESQLGSISEILRRLDDQQRELLTRANEGASVDPRDQSALSDQIQGRAQATRIIKEQLEQSRIRDAQLGPMLESLEQSLSEAERQSQRASESLERDQNEQAIDRMEDVRDELRNAIAMLDRGQDTWLARRSIEELRSKVQSLMQDTKELGTQTGGKSIDQLSEDQRSMLQKILDKQRRVTQDARETIDALDEQADALDKNNPTGAQGIRDAATQGRNSGIEEQLAQAGDELSQNQTSSATGTQEQVLEELDKMLDKIEEAQKNRDSALRRKLASLMESIKAIIEDQQHEIHRLDQAQDGLDAALIALRTNTLAVRDDAAAAFPETQTIADSLTSATESQGDAIAALRGTIIDTAKARQSELAALTHLQAALDEAKKQDQQAADRQAQQLRQELRKQYQEALKEQSRITTETDPLVGPDLNRRQRATARQLSTDEETLRATLSEMLTSTEELSEAPIFSLAHDQLEELMRSVIGALGNRAIAPMTIGDQQGIATILTALVEVLGDEQQPKPKDFEDGQGSEGGGQGSGSGQEPVIPPVAQLKLLRSLQQLTAVQTRALSESDAPDPARLRQIGQLQRQLAEKGTELIESMNPQQPPDEQPIEPSTEEPTP